LEAAEPFDVRDVFKSMHTVGGRTRPQLTLQAFSALATCFGLLRKGRLELSNFCLGAISAASNSPGDGLLAAFEHISHLLDGTPARSPQLAPGAT
jgi:hypothetical protein